MHTWRFQMKAKKWAAMFSVAGGPYEEIERDEDKAVCEQAIDIEALNWSCRTHGFVKEVEDNDDDNDSC